MLSAIIAFVAAPLIGKILGKKRGAIIVGLFAFTIVPAPVVLWLLGLMLENGSPELFPPYLCIIIVDVSLIITHQVMRGSMIADLVEEAELSAERRSEGILFASVTFVRKITRGLGAAFAGLILTVRQFSAGAIPGEVPNEVLTNLPLFMHRRCSRFGC